jgi:hypothetical protein
VLFGVGPTLKVGETIYLALDTYFSNAEVGAPLVENSIVV